MTTRPAPKPGVNLADQRGSEGAPPRIIHYLHPGAMVVSSRPMEVKTILGSCVTVCLWDPGTKIGGANHFLLPTPTEQVRGRLRHGPSAIEALVDKMEKYGANVNDLRAHVAGGSAIIEGLTQSIGNLGQRNRDVALDELRNRRIPVLSVHCGGSTGRKLYFHTDTGHVEVILL